MPNPTVRTQKVRFYNMWHSQGNPAQSGQQRQVESLAAEGRVNNLFSPREIPAFSALKLILPGCLRGSSFPRSRRQTRGHLIGSGLPLSAGLARYRMTVSSLRKLAPAAILLSLTAGLPACVQPANNAELEQLRKDLADAKAAAASAAASAAEAAKAAQAVHAAPGQAQDSQAPTH